MSQTTTPDVMDHQSTPAEMDKLQTYIERLTDHIGKRHLPWEDHEQVFSALSPKHQKMVTDLNNAINEYLKA